MIRPFGLRDVLSVGRLQARGASFDLKRRLLSSLNPTRSAILGHMSGHYLGARTLVHTGSAGKDPLAFIQLMPREDCITWDVVALAPCPSQVPISDDAMVANLWQDLLGYAILTASEQKIARIYAQTPCGDASEMLLRRTGFAIVGCEEIFVSVAEPAAVVMPLGFRQAREEDTWMLQDLYRKVIPPLIYQAQWTGLDGTSAVRTSGDEREGYIWIEGGVILAHLTVESSSRGHWVDCVVRPERRAELLPYIRYLLHLLGGSRTRPVYFAVPDYAVGLAWLLRTLGFVSHSRQQVMVAHTVSRVLVSRPIVVEGLQGQVDVASR